MTTNTRRPIQEEIGQNQPFESSRHEALIALLRTADMVRRCIADGLSLHGITPQQYNVLRILRGAGENGVPTLTIADRMVERSPGVTRLLDRLEGKGWARRRRCDEDRRRVYCEITDTGLELLMTLDPVARRSGLMAMAGVTDPEVAGLLEALAGIRSGMSGS
ncbi:MAG: MarR family transcriptional regulator [Gemmatimonadota bacterium]|nr:MAG: MarR family transcriptional regulator [Gemmatimonadota bacterium]